MKYVVQLTMPFVTRVMIGIEAASADDALKEAKTLSDQGDIMQASEEVPLLSDDFECDYRLESLTIKQELAEDEPWPELDRNVNTRHQHEAAFQVGKLLIDSYRRGEIHRGGIDWSELDQAYQAALRATVAGEERPDRIRPKKLCKRLAIVLKGGTVQAVIVDQFDVAPSVAVVDYDTDGYEPEELNSITQSDGSQSKALVVKHYVDVSCINLDEIFQKFY